MNKIRDFFEENDGQVWFRGHSNLGTNGDHLDYKLNSSLFRQRGDLQSILKLENDYTYEFFHTGYNLHKIENIWSLMFVMQHHGLPTRFLDWTTSLPTALYFARQGWQLGKNKPSLWLVNPIRLNELLNSSSTIEVLRTEQDYFKTVRSLQNSRAVASIKNSNRINAQQGNFTMQGSLLPLDEEVYQAGGNSRIITEIEIPDAIGFDLSIFLAMAGVNHFSVFPDLDGLSKVITTNRYD